MPSEATSSWPVRRAVSAGGVVVRGSGPEAEVALIRTRNLRGEQVWGLPKGTLEAGESSADAAVREVLEETGLQAEIISPLPEISYWFAWPPERVRYRKTVHMFLMRHLGGDTSDHDQEVEEVAFYPLEQAAKKVKHPSERKTLKQAAELVQGW